MRWRLSVALIWLASASLADPLTFLRSISLEGLGGLSAIEVESGGNPALVLSDRGMGYRFSIARAGNTGQITDPVLVNLPYPRRDTEGLATSPTGTFYSYERPGRVSRDTGEAIPSHPDFATHHRNGSLEALAAAPDGTLYTLPEQSGGADDPFPIYRYSSEVWEVIGFLPRQGSFLPTGADIGPDGLLYILERALSPLGFRSRIRQLDPQALSAGVRTLITTGPGLHDNLEGLSVWRSDSGATCLTMVSDDNFLAIQTSELIEYALTETLAGGASCD